jgi:hypothetical protein
MKLNNSICVIAENNYANIFGGTCDCVCKFVYKNDLPAGYDVKHMKTKIVENKNECNDYCNNPPVEALRPNAGEPDVASKLYSRFYNAFDYVEKKSDVMGLCYLLD